MAGGVLWCLRRRHGKDARKYRSVHVRVSETRAFKNPAVSSVLQPCSTVGTCVSFMNEGATRLSFVKKSTIADEISLAISGEEHY